MKTRQRVPKPGRKPLTQRLYQATVTLDREETSALDTLAAEMGRSRSDLIREAVRRTWLNRRAAENGDRDAAYGRPAGREDARERFGELLAHLRATASPLDMSEDELEAFVDGEVKASRKELRAGA